MSSTSRTNMTRDLFFDGTEVFAEDFAKFADGALTSGLVMETVGGDDFKVSASQNSGQNSRLIVAVQPGRCWLKGHLGLADTVTDVGLEPASGTGSRVDRVVARLSYRHNMCYFMHITGNVDDYPNPPPIVRNETVYDIGLATVRVDAGTVKITNAMITDTRGEEGICEYVHYRNSEAAIVDGKADKTALNTVNMKVEDVGTRVVELERKKITGFNLLSSPVAGSPDTATAANLNDLPRCHVIEVSGSVNAGAAGGTGSTDFPVNAMVNQGSSHAEFTFRVDAQGGSRNFTVAVTRNDAARTVNISADTSGSAGVTVYSVTISSIRGFGFE